LGEYIELPTIDAKLLEIFLGLLVVIVVLGIEKYIFYTHWSVVFSSVLGYWSIIGNLFEKKYNSLERQKVV